MPSLILNTLRFLDLGNPREIDQWKKHMVERLVRVILCAGFLAVLAIEASLLIRTLSIFN
jgi:hypothetical protein